MSTEKLCRICLDNEDPNSMIAPCMCKGSQKYVHRGCLDNWRAVKVHPLAMTHCTTCNFKYRIKNIKPPRREALQVCVYRVLIFRDLMFLFMVVQCVLLLVTGGLYVILPREFNAGYVQDSLGFGYMEPFPNHFDPDFHYAIQPRTNCRNAKSSEKFSDIGKAQQMCSKRTHCHGIVDLYCDGAGPFHLCGKITKWGSSSHSCVFRKEARQERPSFLVYYFTAVCFSLFLLGIVSMVMWKMGMFPDDFQIPQCLDPRRCNCFVYGGGGAIFIIIAFLVMTLGVVVGIAWIGVFTKRIMQRHWRVRWLRTDVQKKFVINLENKDIVWN